MSKFILYLLAIDEFCGSKIVAITNYAESNNQIKKIMILSIALIVIISCEISYAYTLMHGVSLNEGYVNRRTDFSSTEYTGNNNIVCDPMRYEFLRTTVGFDAIYIDMKSNGSSFMFTTATERKYNDSYVSVDDKGCTGSKSYGWDPSYTTSFPDTLILIIGNKKDFPYTRDTTYPKEYPYYDLHYYNYSADTEYKLKLNCEDGKFVESLRIYAYPARFSGYVANELIYPKAEELLFNGVTPTKIDNASTGSVVVQDYIYSRDLMHHYKEQGQKWDVHYNAGLEWEIPVSKKCGEIITVKPTVTNPNWYFEGKITSIEAVISVCNLIINNFYGTHSILDPATGGSVRIFASIAEGSGKPIFWEMTVAGKSYSGTGSSVSITWDGKDASGKVVEPGPYSATLTALVEGGECSKSETINFTVTPAPDGQCGLNVNFGSSANVANGNLSHSQELFSSRGTALPLGMTLYYNSLDPFNGSLGLGWSHDYSISLTENSDGSILLKEGNWQRRLYTLSGGTYSAQPLDYSNLVKNSDNTFVLTHKDGLKYTFNSDGTLASMVDRNNNTVAFSYSGGKLTTISDPGGRSASLSYDADGHLTSVTDPAGRNYTLGYSGGTLTNVTYPDGGTWLYTYDDKAFMLSKVDPLGTSTTYTYDDNHRILSATDAEGKIRTINYSTGTETVKTTAFTEKDGGVWQYTYDTEKGTLNQKIDPQGGMTVYSYDGNGNRLSTTGPDGATTSYSYDAQGNMISSSDALGQTTSYTYNSFGQVTTVTDPQGNAARSEYDAKGNLTETTDAAGATTLYAYDAKGNMTKIINPLGQATTFSYDSFGNLVSVTDSAGAQTTFTYDASGNMITLTDPSGAVTRFEYNDNNQPVKTIDPNGNATIYTYDLAGNKISETDANGNTTTFEYNFLRQLVNTKDALGNVTAYTYASSGCASCGGGTDKLTALTDANGHFTTYQYDTLGRLLKETDPLDAVTSYRYDAKGNLVGKTDANGATISYSYDELGRLLKKSYPDGTEETFSYDAKGNILTATNKNISYTYSYDANSRMVSVTDSNNRTLRYDYDLAGNKTVLTMPDGQSIDYRYDTANRLAEIVGPEGVFAFNYDSLGKRTKLIYPNGATASYSYDSASRLTKLEHKNTKGRLIDSFSYSHDKVGNRLTKTEPEGTTTYNYDTIYRLLGASSQKPGHQSDRESYGYDPVGNRLVGPEARQTYQYNEGNQLVEESAEQCRAPKAGMRNSYDKNGNLVMKEERNGSGHAQTTTRYRYDYENRLIKVEIEKGRHTQVVTFSYDPFGKRLSKTVGREDLHENGKGQGHEGCDDGRQTPRTTYYLYDNEDIVMEYDERGETLASYLHGPGVDEPLAMERKDKVYFYHADGLGSITALTDKHGNVVRKYDYDSFGNMAQEQREFGQPYAYTGREWDKETGLYYYRARYYDPMEGRFVSKDPIGFAAGDVNLYGYVQNNPVNWVDPSGLIRPGELSIEAQIESAIVRGDVTQLENLLVGVEESGAPNAPRLIEMIKRALTPARDLIRGRLKCSKSYFRELENKTLAELTKLAKGKGSDANKASKMLKLIKESPRLLDKLGAH